LHLTLTTAGTANPLTITGLNFGATGSTSATDIDFAKIFFTGTSATFATTQQFGASLAIADLSAVNITGSQALAEGLNHFWIAFDIDANATNANLIDAECYAVDFGGNSYQISNYNPADSREVFVPLAENTVQFGFGTGASYMFGPVYRSRADSDYDYSRFSYLYTQAELAAIGILPGSLITKIAWNKTNTYNITNTGNAYFKIYMKNSTRTTLVNPSMWETEVIAGATLVAERIYTQTNDPFAVKGWMEYPLDQTFVYTGGALEISTDWDISGVTDFPTNGVFNFQYTDVAPGRTIAAASNLVTGYSQLVYREPINWYYGDADGSKRPNIKITYSGGGSDNGTTGLSNNPDSKKLSDTENVKVYSFDKTIVIEFSELPATGLTAVVYNLKGQIVTSLPVETLKTVISPINAQGLMIVKIQGSNYQHIKKVYLY
jgi:hypothetical protein